MGFIKGHTLGFKKGYTPWNKGMKMSDEYKQKLIGRIVWNKGTKGIMKANKTSFKKGQPAPEGAFKKGHETWNKGKPYLAIRGENHFNWKGGITPEIMKIRNSIEMKQWGRTIFERDDYTCQICGDIGGKLRANHIKKFSDYEELRLEITNGITICERCDKLLVMWHEPEWESYFNFNLMTRGVMSC